jgi:hypothetical protein
MFFVGGHVGMWGGLVIIFCLGVYPAFEGTTIRPIIEAPFGIQDKAPTDMANVGISCAWYVIAIAIGATIHALIYVVLIRASQGGSLLGSLKATFHHEKKTNQEQTSVSKFDNWYHNSLVQDNWYYRTKVLNKPAIVW